jgi:DNA-binding GntR family transcriptional regulator
MLAAPTPLKEVVATALRQRILSGELRPGKRIREAEFAEEYGVSRVPVREALQQLESEGYVQRLPRRGATVAVPSTPLGLELMQVRRALEVMAARLAAQRRGGTVAEELRRLVRRGDQAAAHKHYEPIPDLAHGFHALVAEASGNSRLIELLEHHRNQLSWIFAADLPHRAADSWSDHAAILQAILAGDDDEAGRQMDVHVAKDEAFLRGHTPS